MVYPDQHGIQNPDEYRLSVSDVCAMKPIACQNL